VADGQEGMGTSKKINETKISFSYFSMKIEKKNQIFLIMLSVSVLLFCLAAVALGDNQPCVVSFVDPSDGKTYNYDIARFAAPNTQKQEFIIGTEANQGWTGTFFFFLFLLFLFFVLFFELLFPSLAHFPFYLSVPEYLRKCSGCWMFRSNSGLSGRWSWPICFHGKFKHHDRFSLL
jgi:hypothetical protein